MYESPIIPTLGGEPGVSPWAGAALGGLGMLGLLGMGLGRKKREPETKREKASAALQSLSELRRDLESMTTDADCLLGSEAQGTISPFNAETNAMLGEIALLRRRVLIVKSRLHAFSIPKIKENLKKFAEEVDAAETTVAEILAMPDVSPEVEAANKQARKDKCLVVQALTMPDSPHPLSKIAETAGIPLERADVALQSLVADGLAETSGEGFKWVGRAGQEPDDKDDLDEDG